MAWSQAIAEAMASQVIIMTSRNESQLAADGLSVTFVITSMPVGGAETLLVNLMRHFKPQKVRPSLICLKEAGPLGEEMAREFPFAADLYRHKWDLRVLPKLMRKFREFSSQAVVTVGAGDKMFWGRIAAKLANVPVIASAIHSTGWPDGIGRLNRQLTPWTDAFIAVAENHAEHLRCHERFPTSKVVTIPNGIDTERFTPNARARAEIRRELGVSKSAQIVGIVAALREEKNHGLFVEAARLVANQLSETQFVIVGAGPCHAAIEAHIARLGMTHRFHLLGSRSDTPKLLAAMDAFALSSHNEANPVSILEALSCEVPVVATRVGSVSEMVVDGVTGYCVEPGNASEMAQRITALLVNPSHAMELGKAGRRRVCNSASLESMVAGYEHLLQSLWQKKTALSHKPVLYPTCQGMVSRPS